MPRELKYFIACTVDGFIAREDGSLGGFLTEGEHVAYQAESFPETIPTHLRAILGAGSEQPNFDTVVMGRRTYDVGRAMGITSPYRHLKQYLFSKSVEQRPDPEVELIKADPLGLVQKLKTQPGKAIWLCGGGNLAGELLSEIDELILKVNPVAFGRGIPLFGSSKTAPLHLRLVSQQVFTNGVMVNCYRPVLR
jgi:dihydrofolate reductase